MSDMETFGSLQAGKDYYLSKDYSDEFNGLLPLDPEDDGTEMDLDETDAEDYIYEKSLMEALDDASETELKAVGLGYVDTDADPSPKPSAARLRRYWTRGEGAAKIRWGTSGDFRRCVKHMRKYVGAGAEGLCNVYHRAALGHAPGQGPHVGGKSDLVNADIETKQLTIGKFALSNLYLSQRYFEGWDRAEAKSGDIFDVGYNILSNRWEAHDAENFGHIEAIGESKADVYLRLDAALDD